MGIVKTVVVLGGFAAAAATCARVSAPPTKAQAAVASTTVALPPLKAAVFSDQTQSTEVARIAKPSIADFTPLFDRLRTSGGEIGFGLIRDHSNKPLIRLYLPPPPEPPTSEAPASGNIFAAANTKKRDEAKRKKYEAARQAWLTDATARINAFIAAVTPLLDAPDDAPRTDVRSAIVRADLFLAEPSPFPRAPECVVVLISDGLDNVNTEPLPSLKSNARVVIANGIGSLGAVEVLAPVRFEAVSAAMRYAAEGGHDAR